MKEIFTLILAIVATTSLWAQRFQSGDLYYQVCTGEGDVIVNQYDTIGWNIPAEAITVSQAREICATLESGATTGTKYYVMGYVKKLHNKHADGVSNYGNAHFYMEEVKGANSSDDFMAFQVYGPNNKKLSDPDAVAVGDFVVIYGELTNYNGTYETVGKGAAYIWKSTNPLLNEQVKPEEPEVLVIPEEAKAWNIPAEAIDVIKAREICAALAAGDSTDKPYYVMGYVKKLHANHASGITGYGNAQFYMENIKDKNSNNDFIAFQVFGLNGTKINDPNAVAVGDFVVVYGKLTNFMGNTYETLGKGSAYIWKSTNPLMVETKPEPEEVTLLDETLTTSLGAMNAVNVYGEQVWKYVGGKNKCVQMNASNIENEDWLVTPELDLTGMSEATLTFKYKFSAEVPAEYQKQYTVLISSTGDVTKAEDWKELPILSYNTTTFTESGAINLPAEMIGKKCYIAWKYKIADTSHTWSLRNVLVRGITKGMAGNTEMENLVAKDLASKEEHYVYVTYQTTAATNYNSLQSVEIPETVEYEGITYNVIGIGFAAFKYSKLESITIPSSVKVVGEQVFDNCSALTSVVWNIKNHADFDYKTIDTTYVYTSPFYNIRSQITSFVFGNEVEYIPAYLCCDMNNLNNITIPNNVMNIGSYALSGTGFYNNESNWENEVLYIDDCLIRAKKTLSGNYAIKDGTRLIAGSAFWMRQELSSITIPNNVMSIGQYAFEGCSGLTSIICAAMTPPTLGNYAFNSVNHQIPVYVPCGAVPAYKVATGWSAFHYIVEPYAIYSIDVNSQNNEMGLAKVEKNTLCEAKISATANVGYHFTQWNDGNTENPRTLVLTQDTALTAEFAITFSGQCGNNLYWNYDEMSQTISITGSGEMYDYTVNTQPWLLFKEQLMEVATSNTTTSIGASAFEECIRLGKLTLGATIENIAANAFAKCNRLYHIYSYSAYPPFAEQSSFANYNVYLHVPCGYKEGYDLDIVWGNFKYIECLSSDKVTTDGVIISPSTNDVTIIWPTEGNADTYTIVIKKGNEVFCTLTFNADGQLLNIAFAPGRNGNHPAQYAEQAGNGYRFTVTGLEEGTHYAYNIDVRDAANKTIKSHTGEFTTESMTAVENTHSQSATTSNQKLLRDGQLIILRDGKTYNTMGAEIR